MPLPGVTCAAAACQFDADGVLAREGLFETEEGVRCSPEPGRGFPVVKMLGGAPVAIVDGPKVAEVLIRVACCLVSFSRY